MIKVRIEVLGATCLLTAILAGCGGGAPDPSIRRAAERCVAEAQNMPAQTRSSAEAGCAKMQTYCETARRDDKLCEAWLQRYK